MSLFSRLFRMTSPATLAAALLVSLAPPARAADPQAGLYTVTVSANISRGDNQVIQVQITPAKDYHWNVDYPAKLQLKNGAKVQFAKTSFSKAEGDITGTEKVGTVTLKASAKDVGTEAIEATMSFSVCNKETCQVLRQRPLPIAVTVK